MLFKNIPLLEPEKTLFSKENDHQEHQDKFSEIIVNIEDKNTKGLRLKHYIKKILRKNQNINFDEGLENLKRCNTSEEFFSEVQIAQHQCFSFFSSAISNARGLRFLNISGIDLDPILAIEIGQALSKNSSLYEVNLSGCKLNNSSLSYIFASIANHQTLQSLNLFNNQGFDNDLVNDLCKFLFKGKNCLQRLKLTHCNISSTAMSFLLRNLKYSKTITELDLSMMDFTADSLTNLGIALQHFKGKKILNYLNIGYSNIQNYGVEVLAQRVNWNIRYINIKELILKGNFINQQGVIHLEKFMKLIHNLLRLDLSQNKIEEFTSTHLLERQLYEINLSHNNFSSFPQQFFMNTLLINLSNNNISTQGAFQLSSILRQNPQWIELNLAGNNIKSEGFNSIIFGLRDNLSLQKLIIARNNLDSESMFTFMINHEQLNLQFLDISYNYIRYAVIFQALKFIKSGTLRSFKCQGLHQCSNEKQEFQMPPTLQQQYKEKKVKFEDLIENFKISQIQNKQQDQFQLSSYNLRELNFSNNSSMFSPIINSLTIFYNRIEILDVSGCKPITDKDLDTLSIYLSKSTIIVELNLSNLSIGKCSQNSISKLRKAVLISNLKSIDLSRNQLFKAAEIVFAEEIISNFKLEKINYSFNGLEAKHSFYLEKLLNCLKCLKCLDLSHNNIDFCGFIFLQKFLSKNASLKTLNLSNQKMSGDDLIILAQIISDQNLTSLNIANNNSIKRMKTFFSLCSQQKQQVLNFNHIFFDNFNFKNTVQLISKQQIHINSVILKSSNFLKKGYEKLVKELVKCKNLQMLSVNYNPFIYIDLDKATYLLNQTKKMKILQFRQITFVGSSFKSIAHWLQNSATCSIESIEIGESQICQRWLDEYCEGIGGNNTLKKIIIEKCNLGQFDLYSFGKAIALNDSLEYISVENNNITNNFANCKKAITESRKIKTIKMLNVSKNPISQITLVNLFSPKTIEKQSLIVTELNFSSCQINMSCFESLNIGLQNYKNDILFNNLKIFSLANNSLKDQVSECLSKFIQNSTCLEQLHLQKNLFTSDGVILLFKAINNIKSIKTVDLSENLLTDSFTTFLETQYSQQFSILFLLLRGNKLTSQGQKSLINVLIKQNQLFIDNIWKFIDDNDAGILLQQYLRVEQKYRLEQHNTPSYIKEIRIIESMLTDKFCENFGSYYPFLHFIELIDISDNPYITMNGKAYLFFHLFDQSFENHNLKAMHISDTNETRKLFDDGVLRYLTLMLRNFLIKDQSSKKLGQSNMSVEVNPERGDKILGGQLGAWVLHKVNKLLFYLDLIEPATFIVSTLFVGKFRKNNSNIKIITILLWIAFIFQNSMQFRNVIYLDYDKLQKCDINDIIKGSCTQLQQARLNNFQFILLCLLVISVLECIQLILLVMNRRKIVPALQIFESKMTQMLAQKYPTRKEWFLLFVSIFRKFETVPERTMLPIILNIKNSDEFLGIFQKLAAAIIILRALDQVLVTLINLIFFLKQNPRQDQAKYLTSLQRNFYYMNHYLPSDILLSFCPIQGFQLNKHIKINYEIIIGLYRILIFDIPMLIIILQFFAKGYIQHKSEIEIWMLLISFKCLTSIISETIKILMKRPPHVKQNSFNQALTIKKFHQNQLYFISPQNLKVEETVKQFLKKCELKREKKLFQNKVDNLSISNEELESQIEHIQEDFQTLEKEKDHQLLSEYSFSQFENAQSPLKFLQPKFKYEK